ncbi:MAG: hypothetical protein ACOC22_00930 [bacterium]
MRKKRTGKIVETKTGKRGKVYYEDSKINGKVVVHLDDEDIKMLCDPKTLNRIGYFD